jgi:branched-chain amino acid transport system permease protein
VISKLLKVESIRFLWVFVGISLICAISGSKVLATLIIMSSIWTILALSMTVLVGYAGQVSLGHAGFFAIGAYTSALLTKNLGFPFLLALIAAAILTGLSGLLLGIPCLRIRGFYLAIATLAFGFIVEALAGELSSFTGGYSGISGVPCASIAGYKFKPAGTYVYLILFFTFSILLSAHNLVNSRIGRALEALNKSESGTLAVGVDIQKLKIELFVVTSVWCGIAGSLYCHYMRIVAPELFTVHVPLMAFAACAIGGIGTIWGSLVGGAAITLLPYALEAYKEWQPTIWSLLVIGIMIFLPRGLFPGILELLSQRRNPLVVPDILVDIIRRKIKYGYERLPH